MKTSKLLALVMALVVVLSFSLVGCKDPKPDDVPTGPNTPAYELTYADGTELRMATGYNNAKTGLIFDASIAGEGITLADGKTYHTGELKPTWVQLQETLGIAFESLYTGKSAADEFKYWQEKLEEVDMVSGSLSVLQTAGANGQLVNIAEYLDAMPNFKAYLEANPIVRLSITGDTSTGAIYFSPYFDGVNDIERMPLMRVDFISKLLDGEGDFTAAASKEVVKGIYTPYMPTSGSVEVDVVKADGTGTEKVVKNYAAYGNIVARMNAEASLTGVQAVNMLRDYIDATYAGYYGTKRSDLFAGQNAAWDADELAALLRCVVANPQTLNGTETIQGLFSREEHNNQRRVDLFRFAGTLFGVRGLESRQDYLYFDKSGNLHDARQEVATYEALERMNALKAEGLISEVYNTTVEKKSDHYLAEDSGFMSYDYNQTQTVYNATKLQEGEKYMAVMVPVARWNDGGETEKFMRFTESWRSVKTDGWAISKAGVEGSKDKLNAALKLIDYAYSVQGQILMSYGPDAFIKVKNANVVVETWEDVADKYHTFNFNGVQMPMIADATEEELWSKASGNYTNYARQFLGSTLSFVKSQAFEVQCTHTVGREGAQQIALAIGFGTIKHPELAVCDNMWYTSIPTNLPTNASEEKVLGEFSELASSGKFSQSKNNTNCLVNLISGGWAAFSELARAEVATPAEAAALVSGAWNGDQYLMIKSLAWTRLLTFYAK